MDSLNISVENMFDMLKQPVRMLASRRVNSKMPPPPGDISSLLFVSALPPGLLVAGQTGMGVNFRTDTTPHQTIARLASRVRLQRG